MIIADPVAEAADLACENQRLRGIIREQNARLDAVSKELWDRQYAARWGITYERLLELDAKFYEALRRIRNEKETKRRET